MAEEEGAHRHDAGEHGHVHSNAADDWARVEGSPWWRSLLAHHQAHHDHRGVVDFGRGFAIGTALNLGFVVAEIGFGLAANSLALIADGAHNLSDAIALFAAWFASWLGRLPPTGRRTCGYRRASIMAALLNAALLIGATAIIIFEAVRRLIAPAPVAEKTVILVAALGIAVNVATALLFMRGREADLNARGAFVHMAADAAVSAGVVGAGLMIALTGKLWIDPLVSLFIGVAIIAGSWRVTRDTVDMALDAVPAHVDPGKVEGYLRGLPSVASVHDLHIWAMSTTETALTVHLVCQEPTDDKFLVEAREGLRKTFAIQHVTLQVESGDPAHPCAVACEENA
jgi:cobalt-zinc-cadmium efflux system protein